MKTNNHESWHRCSNCGHEYNFWQYGYDCPACKEPKTVGEFFKKMQKDKNNAN